MDSANAAVIYDDDDDDVNDIATTDAPVQLGFVEDLSGPLLHQLGDWNKWDGGKVGGKPVGTWQEMLYTCKNRLRL